MARIIDKDTRLIDIDFGELTTSCGRSAGSNDPDAVTLGGNGLGQLLNSVGGTEYGAGSFMQYVRLDLDFMTRNNEVMLPVEASIQRTSPVPLGGSNNGNNFDQIEEFIFILSRPLNNTNIAARTDIFAYDEIRNLGLNGTTGSGIVSGNSGWPNQAQTIYAEKRMYSYNNNLGATQSNGELLSGS